MKTLIVILLTALSYSLIFSQGLNDVYSPSLLNVYAAGKSGLFLKSTNAGSVYSSIVIGDVDLNSVFSLGQRVWVAGNNGKLFRSTDQAVSWNEISVMAGVDLHGLAFADSSTGYVCTKGGKIFKSTDGGLTWISQNTGVLFDLKSIKFINAMTGYCTGESSLLLKTSDGGLTWSQVTLPFSGKVRSLDCSGNEIIAGANSGLLLRSTDNGQSWTAIKLNIQSLPAIISLKIISPQNYFLALESGGIWRTTNGGITFDISRNEYRDEITSLTAIGSRMYITGKNYNVLARSIDAGLSFTLTPSTTYTISFVQLFDDDLQSFNRTL